MESSVIHIATHSFRIIYHPKVRNDILHVGGLSKHKEPLLHTGLIFTGANHTWENLQQLGTDDGILTALEIESMNLSGVELAVLSGCNTGNGDTRYGENIFSLQRAFRQAGVKAQIISFRDVSDQGDQRTDDRLLPLLANRNEQTKSFYDGTTEYEEQIYERAQ